MKDQTYGPFEDTGSESPAGRFVIKLLLDAVKRDVIRIRFERIPQTDEKAGRVSVYYLTDEGEQEIGQPPYMLWHNIVSRLKIMARMVDYGPDKSTDGRINLRMSKNRKPFLQLFFR